MKIQSNSGLALKFKNDLQTSFHNLCIKAICLAYTKMLEEKKYKVDWKEDKITVLLAKTIKSHNLAEADIDICAQYHLFSDAVAYGNANPAEAPIIDFRFRRYWAEREYLFFAEAKNLSEKNWKKLNGSGALVRASKYYKRYVETGVMHYLTSYYPKGVLLGYVVNGKVPNVLYNLNKLILDPGNKIDLGEVNSLGHLFKDANNLFGISYLSDNVVAGKAHRLQHLMFQLA